MTLPLGFRVRLASGARSLDGGRVIIGGSPLTAVRLSERAAAMLDDDGVVTVSDSDSAHLAERLLATNLGVPELSGAPEVDATDLTVVIPVRDRCAPLERALAALRPLRCVVVDDASVDAAAAAAVARRHGADLVRLPHNVGPAAARNAGLARVTTAYVAFVDSDVVVRAADLLRLTTHVTDPAVGLVGPRLVAVTRSARASWFERYEVIAPSLSLGHTPCVVRPGAAVSWLPSACLIARRSALAGGFSADLRVGEDVDLVWRLIDAGHRVRYDPAVTALHDSRTTLRSWLGRKAYYGSGGAELARRHGGRLAPVILTPAYAAAAAAVFLGRPRTAGIAATAALVHGSRRVHQALPPCRGSGVASVRIAASGFGWALRQESALLVRHWWPAAAISAAVAPPVRRAVVRALLVDTVVAMVEHRNDGAHDPGTLVLGRRLDDLAYGAGLWAGSIRARSWRALLPRRPARGLDRGTDRRPGTTAQQPLTPRRTPRSTRR